MAKQGKAGTQSGKTLTSADAKTKRIIKAYQLAQSLKTGRGKVTDADLAAALKTLKSKKRPAWWSLSEETIKDMSLGKSRAQNKAKGGKVKKYAHGGKVRSYNFIN